MTNLIDSYLLKSGMPKHELCIIGRAKRAFYYYGVTLFAVSAVTFFAFGLIRMIG